MDKTKENKPSPVPKANHEGEAQGRYAWVESAVWTDRMLTALAKGVRGGRWYSLIDKVGSLPNLRAAFKKVKANRGKPGVDHQTIAMFETRLETKLSRLSEQIHAGRYRPQAIRRVWIRKASGGKRPLGIPTVRDRVVQTALRNVLEPILEREFATHSYGFRPGKGCKDALRRVDTLLRQGFQVVVDADLKSYFDTIPHSPLLAKLSEKITDQGLIAMVQAFLDQKVLEDLKEWTPIHGTPQGAVISPLLSNLYLNPLDHLMEKEGYEMVRYADDFVILCRDEDQARKALELIRGWVSEAGLILHPEKTKIVDSSREGFDFLGFTFQRLKKKPRKSSLEKLKETIRRKTRRANGHSLFSIIASLNRTLKGWFEYFKHSNKTVFRNLECWIRMRLRSILRSRQGRKGRGGGQSKRGSLDHYRWPNAYFAKLGLYSLTAARVEAVQSVRR